MCSRGRISTDLGFFAMGSFGSVYYNRFGITRFITPNWIKPMMKVQESWMEQRPLRSLIAFISGIILRILSLLESTAK